MYLVKIPNFIRKLFPNFIWRLPTEDKVVYLTFDDGPIPEVTPWVLDLLEEYNAKATFFCVGENVKQYSDLLEKVRKAGHSVGNHTFSHLNGWLTDNVTYLRNVRKGAHAVHSELFRPPYGKVKPSQAKFLNRHYRVVMWDVLSGDFDPALSKEQCLENVIKNTEKGSIIVFHDSLKAKDKLEYVLPKTLEHFAKQGYRFEALAQHTVAKKNRQFA
ncbi:MAG: peptidoglycan/xylan/chitin deacetylase (PgdA/CDA1 family) [Maribacter sp.]|jgi:peptidoglycan/xylan/chitin deacetylase (PgdA/CDA1 family)